MSYNFQYDVVVIGAGSAGVAAACQAATSGVKVALVERLNASGGKATAAEVRTLCGFYISGRKERSFVNKGFPKLFADRMMALENKEPLSFDQNLHFIPYHPYSFKWLSDQFLKESGVDVYYHSYPIEIKAENASVKSLKVLNKEQVLNFETKMVIDCSGESVVSALLNLPQITEDSYQAPTQIFTIGKIDLPDDAMLNLLVNKAIISGVKTGKIPEYFDRVSVVPGSFKNGNASFKLSLPELLQNGINKHSDMEVESRDRVGLVYLFLRNNIEAFKHSELNSVASELGIRIGRRTEGKYTLTKEDVLQSKRFDDVVARGSWPIEKWGVEKRVSMSYPESGDFYDIPLGCIQSAHYDNLLMAGRNISTDNEAIASARVIGICMATGAAAGMFAANKLLGSSDKEILSFINRELLLNL